MKRLQVKIYIFYHSYTSTSSSVTAYYVFTSNNFFFYGRRGPFYKLFVCPLFDLNPILCWPPIIIIFC